MDVFVCSSSPDKRVEIKRSRSRLSSVSSSASDSKKLKTASATENKLEEENVNVLMVCDIEDVGLSQCINNLTHVVSNNACSDPEVANMSLVFAGMSYVFEEFAPIAIMSSAYQIAFLRGKPTRGYNKISLFQSCAVIRCFMMIAKKVERYNLVQTGDKITVHIAMLIVPQVWTTKNENWYGRCPFCSMIVHTMDDFIKHFSTLKCRDKTGTIHVVCVSQITSIGEILLGSHNPVKITNQSLKYKAHQYILSRRKKIPSDKLKPHTIYTQSWSDVIEATNEYIKKLVYNGNNRITVSDGLSCPVRESTVSVARKEFVSVGHVLPETVSMETIVSRFSECKPIGDFGNLAMEFAKNVQSVAVDVFAKMTEVACLNPLPTTTPSVKIVKVKHQQPPAYITPPSDDTIERLKTDALMEIAKESKRDELSELSDDDNEDETNSNYVDTEVNSGSDSESAGSALSSSESEEDLPKTIQNHPPLSKPDPPKSSYPVATKDQQRSPRPKTPTFKEWSPRPKTPTQLEKMRHHKTSTTSQRPRTPILEKKYKRNTTPPRSPKIPTPDIERPKAPHRPPKIPTPDIPRPKTPDIKSNHTDEIKKRSSSHKAEKKTPPVETHSKTSPKPAVEHKTSSKKTSSIKPKDKISSKPNKPKKSSKPVSEEKVSSKKTSSSKAETSSSKKICDQKTSSKKTDRSKHSSPPIQNLNEAEKIISNGFNEPVIPKPTEDEATALAIESILKLDTTEVEECVFLENISAYDLVVTTTNSATPYSEELIMTGPAFGFCTNVAQEMTTRLEYPDVEEIFNYYIKSTRGKNHQNHLNNNIFKLFDETQDACLCCAKFAAVKNVFLGRTNCHGAVNVKICGWCLIAVIDFDISHTPINDIQYFKGLQFNSTQEAYNTFCNLYKCSTCYLLDMRLEITTTKVECVCVNKESGMIPKLPPQVSPELSGILYSKNLSFAVLFYEPCHLPCRLELNNLRIKERQNDVWFLSHQMVLYQQQLQQMIV